MNFFGLPGFLLGMGCGSVPVGEGAVALVSVFGTRFAGRFRRLAGIGEGVGRYLLGIIPFLRLPFPRSSGEVTSGATGCGFVSGTEELVSC